MSAKTKRKEKVNLDSVADDNRITVEYPITEPNSLKALVDNLDKPYITHTVRFNDGKQISNKDVVLMNDILNTRVTVDTKIKNVIDSILTMIVNRELKMNTNIVSIDSVDNDLKDLRHIEDALLMMGINKTVNYLQHLLKIDTDIKFKHTVTIVEEVNIIRTGVKIKIPPEIINTPMDITRHKIMIDLLNDLGIENDDDIPLVNNKLNLLMDGNMNLFLINRNMHKRIVIKLFTINDCYVGKIIQ